MRASNNPSPNKKALPKFLLWVVGGALFGGVMGFLTGFAGAAGMAQLVGPWIGRVMTVVTPWGIPVVSGGLLIAAFGHCRSARKLAAGWDGEDEDLPDRVDARLNYVLLCSTLALICSFFFLAAGTIYVESWRISLLVVGELTVSCVLEVVAQQKAVDLTRRMNPEKTVSVYDTKFNEKWYETCDEAEREQIGQASYQAFRVTNTFCIVLWLVLLLLNYVFEFGLLPMAAVLLVWAVLQVSYIVKCIQLGKGGRG